MRDTGNGGTAGWTSAECERSCRFRFADEDLGEVVVCPLPAIRSEVTELEPTAGTERPSAEGDHCFGHVRVTSTDRVPDLIWCADEARCDGDLWVHVNMIVRLTRRCQLPHSVDDLARMRVTAGRVPEHRLADQTPDSQGDRTQNDPNP